MNGVTWKPPRVRMDGPVSRPEREDWAHAAEAVPLATALLLAAAAAVYAAGLPWWLLPAVELPGAAVAVVAAAMVTASGPVITWTAAAGAAAAGWSTWAAAAGPWHVAPLLVLAAAMVVLGVLYPVVRGRYAHEAAAARRRDELARLAADARRWPELLAAHGARGVRQIEKTETRSGHMYRFALPSTGKVTYAQLVALNDKLEAATKLRPGAIRWELGDHSGEVLLHVSEKDVLAQVIPYPDDLDPLTVNEPFGVGLLEDGSPCDVLYREVAMLIVGLRGSGKSNLLNVLIAQLGRCVDTLIFMIDLKGGRAALPWIRPWMEGRTPRPVIDWVATDRDEAERMLSALLRAVDARSRSGAGGEKITPSEGQPAVVLVFDEMAVVFGAHGGPATKALGTTNRQMAGMGTQLVQLGRSEAIDLILATQRATVTMTGGGDLKSQCSLRVGLGVTSEQDARYIIPDDQTAAKILPRLRHPGTGLVSDGGSLAPVKFYRMEPGRISRIAAELGQIRPEPDDVLAAALGPDYAARWSSERAGDLPGWDVAAARTEQEEIAELLDEVEAEYGDEVPVHPARARMRVLLAEAGVRGMTTGAIGDRLEAEELKVARGTVSRWLKEDAESGLVHSASFGRWKTGAA